MKNLRLVLFFGVLLGVFLFVGSATSSTSFTSGLNSLLASKVTAGDSAVVTLAADVEGVIIEHQQTARLKPGYTFRRESRNSISVWKTSNVAALQMGTLTCTRPRKGDCYAEINGDYAKCSSACYFVGVRGGTRAQ